MHEKQEIKLVAILIAGFLLGIIVCLLVTEKHDIDTECVALEIENEMNNALESGFFLHGVLNIDNTIRTGINYYNMYNYEKGPMPARYLMRSTINHTLQKCKKKKN